MNMLYLLFLITAFYFGFITVCGDCPDEWTSYSGSCYALIDVAESWAEAAEICERLKGYIVEITETDENDFVKRFVKNRKVTSNVWIGGSDLVKNGTWRWLFSRNTITFFDWAHGEPVMGSSSRCIQLWASRQFSWDDTYCDLKNVFVCETGKIGLPVIG